MKDLSTMADEKPFKPHISVEERCQSLRALLLDAEVKSKIH
jgi:hypothetical protein